jgi:pimeloyl-ACP methyl ester carboxylesterase
MRFKSLIAVGAVLALAGCAGSRQAARAPDAPLALERFGDLSPAKVRNLVVIVHDDLAPDQPVDYAAFARRAAQSVPAGTSVVVLRPGYADGDGDFSPGVRARGIGDGYAGEQVKLLGLSVQALRARYRQARTIVVGDGGGAALAANLAATQPGLVDAMLLVGCPCALPEWRQYMARRDKSFGEAVDSLDPLRTVGGIAPGARVAIVSGGDRARVPARIARLYAEALALRGIAVEYRQVEADGTDLLQTNDVTQLLAQLATPAADPTT